VNPYPYIKNSNLLVSLSISETFSYVIHEAKILGVPVISTPFGSMGDVMGYNDMVVDLQSIPKEIDKMVEDNVYYNSVRKNVGAYEDGRILSSVDILFN
jgi:glycosyltransferase involved in cell wall biosynthesis